MKLKVIISILLMVLLNACYICESNAQTSNYQITQSELIDASTVKLTIMVYSNKKKLVEDEASCAAIRAVLFKGCGINPYTRPLLDDGEITSMQNNPQYFTNLFNNRYKDFVKEVLPISGLKKGDKKKGTAFEVTVRVMQLRKDLEKNNIRKTMGL